MKKCIHRMFMTLFATMLTFSIIVSTAFAETVEYGESWQVIPGKTYITGSGQKNSGYNNPPADYLGYGFGGGARGKWLSSTGAFIGTIGIYLYKYSSPANPIAKSVETRTFPAHVRDYSTPSSSSKYIATYAEGNLDIVTAQKYQYTAVSTNIPSSVRVYYLFFLNYVG